jgi:hypothetical protein
MAPKVKSSDDESRHIMSASPYARLLVVLDVRAWDEPHAHAVERSDEHDVPPAIVPLTVCLDGVHDDHLDGLL